MAVDIAYRVDPTKVIEALQLMNTAQQDWEKGAEGANEKAAAAFQKMGDLLLKSNDKFRNSLESTTRSLERQADMIGKSPVEKLIAQRDQLIAKEKGHQDLIDRTTQAYGRLIAAEQAEAAMQQKRAEAQALAQRQSAATGFVQQFAQNPLQAIQGLAGSVGGTAALIGGIAAGFTALSVGVFQAAKSLGAYGTEIRNAEIRTGLTAKEVGQFSFAAKVAGSDISAFETAMRRLSQGLADGSDEGKKAREALSDLGIRTRETNGDLRPMSQIFLQISDSLTRIEDPTKRDAEAIRLFGRAGVELLPVLIGLRQNVDLAKSLGFGPSEAEIAKITEYQKQVAILETAWGGIVRHLKEFLVARAAASVEQAGKTEAFGMAAFLSILSHVPGVIAGTPPLEHSNAFVGPRINAAELTDRTAADAAVRGELARRNQTLEGAQANLEHLKESATKARNEFEALQDSGAGLEAVNRAKAAMNAAETSLHNQTELVKVLQKEESKRVELLEKQRDLIAQGEGFYTIGSGRLATVVSEQQIQEANPRVRGVPSMLRRGEYNPATAAGPTIFPLPEGLQNFGTEQVFVSPDEARNAPYEASANAQLQAFGAGLMNADKQKQEQAVARLKLEEQATARLVELRAGPGGELATARKVADLRQAAIEREYQLTGNLTQAQEASYKNQLDLSVQIAEVEQKRFNQVRDTSEHLYHTLFTRPQDFGKQLSGTLRDAALHPLEQGLGTMTAQLLGPLFGGRQDPVKALDTNTNALMQSAAATNHLANLLSAGVGSSMPAGASPLARLLGIGKLPHFAEGGVTTGPSIVGEDGQELVIPIEEMKRRASMLRGGSERDVTLKHRGLIGLLRESHPDIADWIEGRIAITKDQFSNPAVGGYLPGPMTMEIGAEALSAKALLARQSYRGGGAEAQKIADLTELRMSKALKIPRSPFSREGGVPVHPPFDLQNDKVAIEVKSITEAAEDRIYVKAAAKARKNAVVEELGVVPYTLAVDLRASRPVYYLRQGYGAFRLGSMQRFDRISDVRSALPSYQFGGPVEKTGPALVHAGEFVLPSAWTDLLGTFLGGGGTASPARNLAFSSPQRAPLGGGLGGRAVDSNTVATIQNTAAMANLSTLLSMGVGTNAPTAAMGGGFSGGGSSSGGGGFANIPTPFGFSIPIPMGGGFTGGDMATIAGPGGTGGFAGPVSGVGGRGGFGGGSGIGGLAGGIGKLFGGLGSAGGGLLRTSSVSGDVFGTLGSFASSKIGGTLELAAGSQLAQAGLLGNRRGTLAGGFESVAGGAGIGAGIGTMIMPGLGTALGAGIGAAAGGLAAIGEKLAGVESPENEAKRLVRDIYHVSIDTQMAKQIVQIAQKYGNHVSIAVRSPEVRQMLGLYAAGTGQKLPPGASTPMGASLQEQGGKLYQAATYQYGQAYSYQSSLPVAGGVSTTALGGPSTIVVNNQLPGDQVGNYMDGRTVATVTQLPTRGAIQQPGLIV